MNSSKWKNFGATPAKINDFVVRYGIIDGEKGLRYKYGSHDVFRKVLAKSGSALQTDPVRFIERDGQFFYMSGEDMGGMGKAFWIQVKAVYVDVFFKVWEHYVTGRAVFDKWPPGDEEVSFDIQSWGEPNGDRNISKEYYESQKRRHKDTAVWHQTKT